MTPEFFQTGAKLKRNTRGVDVIQSVYAFAMALGLTEVFVGSKTFLSDLFFGVEGRSDARSWVILALLVNVVLLGLRFFWVPRNLSALIFKAAQCAALGKARPDGKLDLSDPGVALHMTMILVHGLVFFLMCGEFKYVVFLSSSNLPLNSNLFTGYIIMHISLLLMNAAWIGFIQIQEDHIEARAGLVSADPSSASSVWWLNNLLCALLALAPFAVSGPCGLNVASCNTHAPGILDVAPLSAHQLSVIFQPLAGLLSRFVGTGSSPGLLWALTILFCNSLFDLCTTGRSYLLFEDAEWERDTGAPAPGLGARKDGVV